MHFLDHQVNRHSKKEVGIRVNKHSNHLNTGRVAQLIIFLMLYD